MDDPTIEQSDHEPERGSRRRIAQLVCLRCAPARAAYGPQAGSDRLDRGTDQAAVHHAKGSLALYPCRKCKTWSWEFRGDFRGMLVQADDEGRLERMFKRADPSAVRKSPVFRTLCAVLDAGMVRAADGTMSSAFCAACEQHPHPVGGSCGECPCHDAWEYRRRIEAEEAA